MTPEDQIFRSNDTASQERAVAAAGLETKDLNEMDSRI